MKIKKIKRNYSKSIYDIILFIFRLFLIILTFFIISNCKDSTETYPDITLNEPLFSSQNYIEIGDPNYHATIVYKVALSVEGITALENAISFSMYQEYASAITDMEKVLLNEGASICAWEQLGRLYYLDGRFSDAIFAFKKGWDLAREVDPYLTKVCGQWIARVKSGQKLIDYESLFGQLFPGNIRYIIENRIRPLDAKYWGTPNLLHDGNRYILYLPGYLPLEILEYGYSTPDIIAFGSSLCREGFRPDKFWNEIKKVDNTIGPAVNLGASNAAPVFWLSVINHITPILERTDRKLKAAIVMTDPWSLSDEESVLKTPFTRTIPPEIWNSFQEEKIDYFQLWPEWTKLRQNGEWHIPSNWEILIQDPANYLYATSAGMNYIYPGNGSINSEAFRQVLRKLKQICEYVIVIDAPIPLHQMEVFLSNSAYPGIMAICQEENVSHYHLSLKEWGLDVRHFFGSMNKRLTSIDFHLNYLGSYICSTKLGNILAAEMSDS